MPKLYEYLGLDVFFYSNEHQPGRPPLKSAEMDRFREVVNARAEDIVQKWVDYFVLHKSVSLEKITKELP